MGVNVLVLDKYMISISNYMLLSGKKACINWPRSKLGKGTLQKRIFHVTFARKHCSAKISHAFYITNLPQ